ncbi:MAG: ATP synthase F1 subunit delta [Clostridia bacterium]|nr:ATP synthase F1 subunit delta [Clostridia bacterium]
MPLVEKRYAEALVELAAQAAAVEEYRKHLREAAAAFEGVEELRDFLLSAKVSRKIKKDMLNSLFAQEFKKDMLNFLFLLVDKDRIRYLPGIEIEFIKLAERKNKILGMKIISAAPLDETQLSKIKEKFRRQCNAASVSAEVSIDRTLLGGVKVVIGDKVFDGSLKGRISKLMDLVAK